MNEHEAVAILKRAPLTGELNETIVNELLNELGGKSPSATILMTLGAKGSACRTPDGKTYHQPIFPVEVVDTTAAGDTFTGYFLTAHLNQRPMPECLKRAAMASSITVSRPGAAPSIPDVNEVEEALQAL